MENHLPVIRIFFGEYVCKVMRCVKSVKANMSSLASRVVMFYGKLYCPAPLMISV
jgi:hypothetical protein